MYQQLGSSVDECRKVNFHSACLDYKREFYIPMTHDPVFVAFLTMHCTIGFVSKRLDAIIQPELSP